VDVEEEEGDEVEEEDVEEEDRSEDILCGKQGKCRTLLPQPAFCVSLRSRNAHGHVRRGILRGNLQENAGPVSRGQHFAGACAVKMNMDMLQEAFCAEIYGENAKRFRYTTSIEHRALTLTARTPQCGHTVWGTIQKVHPPTPKKKTHQVQSSISKIALCLWGCLGPG